MINYRQLSMDVIHAGQAISGAYVASPTFSQYGYSWLRDGTWIAAAMAKRGERASAEAFHSWAARTLLRYEAQIEHLLAKLERGETPAEADYLPTRFHVDGELGQEEWTDFQLDGYGAWLWGLAEFCQTASHPLWQEARPAVHLLVRYLQALWQSPNYDCWEENRNHIHTATLAAIYGGFTSVRRLDPELVSADWPTRIREYVLATCVARDGHFVKYIGNEEVDASLLWTALPFELVAVDDPLFVATLAKVERDLHYPGGGVYRFKADTYFGGGEWLLLAAWLGWAYIETGRADEARPILRWIEAQATESGEMPEQVDTHCLDASYVPYWINRWGTSACPLLWSHAMYLLLEARLREES